MRRSKAESLRQIGLHSAYCAFVSICLLTLLQIGHSQTKRSGQMHDHVIQLVTRLKDPDPQVRLDAARELRDMDDARIVEPLIEALKDPDHRVRATVATALGRTNDPRAIPPLKQAQSDSDPLVRANSATALSKLGNRGGLNGAGREISHGQTEMSNSTMPAGTIRPLQTSLFVPPAPNNESCSRYVPDYAKYHTIVEILDNQSEGVTASGGSDPAGLPIYRVNAEGQDPVSGEDRRLGLAMSFDPLAETQQMRNLFGEPGTRITFHGDASHPFAPAPGIRVWDGSIDIDPKCGMVIRAHSDSDPVVKVRAHPPKTVGRR